MKRLLRIVSLVGMVAVLGVAAYVFLFSARSKDDVLSPDMAMKEKIKLDIDKADQQRMQEQIKKQLQQHIEQQAIQQGGASAPPAQQSGTAPSTPPAAPK